MAYPTQSGDVLTAATLNTFPLVRLFEGVLGGSSYTVSNVFNSTYDAYRIICAPLGVDTVSNTRTLFLRMRTTFDDTGLNYAHSQYGHYGSTAFNGGASAQNAMDVTTISYIVHGHLALDIMNPNLTAVTTVGGEGVSFQVNVGAYVHRSAIAGSVATLTNYTGFTLFHTGTEGLTGTIRVYGYNQA